MTRNFDELKRELLDHRLKLVDWWLAATAIFLTSMSVFMTFFAIVIAIVGYFGFQRFEDIETRAEGHMKVAKERAEEATRFVNLIRGKYAELENLDAKSIGKNLAAALKEAESVQEDPTASLIDQAIAAAVQLQGQEKIEAAIEMWRYIANVAEGVDTQLQARAWLSVGYFYSEEANWEAAIDAYDKAVKLAPDMAAAYNGRGYTKAAGLGRYEAALADYDKVIALTPDDATAYNNRGLSKYWLGRYEAALADYDKALELAPDMAEAYNNRGYARAYLKQYEAALADSNKALELAPDMAEAYDTRGVAKTGLEQYEAALADYDEAIRLKPDMAAAYNNRGNARKNLGRLNEAREDFQKALALAQESGNEDLIAKVQSNLSQLDNDEAP